MDKLIIKLINFLDIEPGQASDESIKFSREELKELLQFFVHVTRATMDELSIEEYAKEIESSEKILSGMLKDIKGRIDLFDFVSAFANL